VYEGAVSYFSLIMWCPQCNILIYSSWRTDQGGGLHFHIIWLLWIDICKATSACLLSPPPSSKCRMVRAAHWKQLLHCTWHIQTLIMCLTVSNKTCLCMCLISWSTFSAPLIIAEESWELIKSFYGSTLSRKVFLWQRYYMFIWISCIVLLYITHLKHSYKSLRLMLCINMDWFCIHFL